MPLAATAGRHSLTGASGREQRSEWKGKTLLPGSAGSGHMPGLIKHRGVRIVTLESGDTVVKHARPGDIMIEQKKDGWYLHFIAEDGSVESYEDPFESHTKALWSAKAAAEFQASGE